MAKDDATRTVSPVVVSTSVDKSISPSRIPAGDSATGTITATNTGAPVKTMTVTDADGFFDASTTFGGFEAGISYPSAASTGKVVYHLAGGGTQVVDFADGAVPAAPLAGSVITGFDLVFSAAGDAVIGNNEKVTTKFTINTSSDQTVPSDGFTKKNSASSEVEAGNGQKGTATDSADLTVLEPSIDVSLDKSMKPGDNVYPGQSVVADIKSTTQSKSDYVKPNKIVVEDSWGETKPENGFWNGFNLTSIQPTQVPAGAALTVEVQKADGSWITLDIAAAQSDSSLYQLNAADLQGKLPAGVTPDSLTGIRFTFEKSEGVFPASTTVQPYVSYTARDTTRTRKPTDSPDANGQQQSTKYKNTATTTGSGQTNDGKEISDSTTDDAGTGIIVDPNGGGVGPNVYINKAWDKDSVASQSGEQAVTHLNWKVTSVIASATITDPMNGLDNPKGTVFDAFDLTSIRNVPADSTPYSNGWYLKYDTISKVEIYENGSWVTLSPRSGFSKWQTPDGSFIGQHLSADQSANTTGVRITLVPNEQARKEALKNGSDPYAPAPGTGIVSSSANRVFDLAWTVRDKTRSDGSFVTSKSKLNGGEGTVENTVAIDGQSASGSKHDEGRDTIVIQDQPPLVSVTKATEKNNIQVPTPGADQNTYPTNSYTLKAYNNSVSKAQYVRVTDPSPCTDTTVSTCQTSNTAADALANPFLGNADVQNGILDTDLGTPNPFSRQNITKLTIGADNSSEVDLSQSKVWLLHFTPGASGSTTGTYSYTQHSVAAVNSMSSDDLADVVGVSVTFQGSNPGSTGGTISEGNALNIKIDTQVRSTLRTTGAPFVPRDMPLTESKNRVFAQSYDTVTAAPKDVTGDTDSAIVNYNTGTIDVSPKKTITDGAITVVDPDEVQKVALSADQGVSTVSPKSVVLTDMADGSDGSTNFWTNFDLKTLDGVSFPAGADQVKIDAYGPFGAGGASDWIEGDEQASSSSTFALPVSTDQYKDVSGLRFTFSRADGQVFSSTTDNWKAAIDYSVVLRDNQRGTSTPVVFPGNATNKMSAQSNGAVDSSAVKPATADVNWTPGTHFLAIDKLANDGVRSASVGSMVPWDITISNTGTGYLDLTKVVDSLPKQLLYTGAGSPADPEHPIKFTPGKLADGTAGTLTKDPTVDSSDSTKLVFKWPEGESRMQPGETAKIRVWLELQPGAVSGEKITNEVAVDTAQTLDGVSDAILSNGAGDVTKDGDNGAKTTDYVSPTTGENLFVVKGVSGSLNGAINTLNPEAECQPTLTGADEKTYFRSPCAANSTVNGTDDWILHMVNAGTTAVHRAQYFEQLPVQGDKYLIASGNGRGTQYRPQLVAEPKIVGAPAGTTTKVEVTTDANACVGTWSSVDPSKDACTSNDWKAADANTDWSKVSGLRITLDFTTSDAGALKPGQGADVTYSSENAVKTGADGSGAATDVPATDQFAWNQFGLLYSGESNDKIAPQVVGVHLRTGSIEVNKTVSGDATSYAPEKFTATIKCTVPDAEGTGTVPLTFAGNDSKQVTLTKASDGKYSPERIAGIPVGANCVVKEDGQQGDFGEIERDPADGVTLQVNNPDTYTAGDSDSGNPTNEVPTAQIANLDNKYNWSGLQVTKKVDTHATAGQFGPFTFTLKCTIKNGTDNPTPVKFGDDDETTFTIDDGETWVAPENTIPAGANCVLTETDSSASDSTVITGDNVVDNGTVEGNPQATITIGKDANEVVSSLVTNHYDAGTFTVTKKVDGEGAATYGKGPFTFHSVCTYKGDQTLLDETYELAPDASKTFGNYPAGTECVTKETKSGGANASTITPVDPEDDTQSKIVIQRQTPTEGEDAAALPSASESASPRVSPSENGESQLPPLSNIDVMATNTFNVGSLKINKVRDGAGADLYGKGPFEAQIKCTYQKNGETTPIDLPNGGMVELSSANNYSATIDGLLVGSNCNVNETKTGGATSSTIDPADGNVTITDSATDPITVTLTNTFDVGSIKIIKKRVGPGVDQLGNGPFTANIKCTLDVDGNQSAISFPNNGNLVLSKSNGYTATLGNVPIGAECSIAETDRGAADKTTIDNPEVTVTSDSPEAVVTITNHFPKVPGKKELPNTGYGIGGLLAGLGILVAGVTLLLARRRRNQ